MKKYYLLALPICKIYKLEFIDYILYPNYK